MGLREDIQTDIGNSFDTDLADAVKTIYLVKNSDVYSPDTGDVTTAETKYLARGVLDNYAQFEVTNESVMPTDIKAIILQNELLATPEIDDYIEYGIIRYKIIKVKADPADAHWEIQCRL